MRNVVKCLTSFIGSGVLHRFYCTLNSVSTVVPLSIVVMRNIVKTLTSFIGSGVLHWFYCTLTLFQLWCLWVLLYWEMLWKLWPFYKLWRFTQVLLYPHFISAVVCLSIVVMRNVVKTLTSFIDWRYTGFTVYSLYFSCGAFEYCFAEKSCENFGQFYRLWCNTGFTVPSLYFSCGAFEYCCDEKSCGNFGQFYRLWRYTGFTVYSLYFSCGAFEYCCDEKSCENFGQFYRPWCVNLNRTFIVLQQQQF